MLLTADCWLRSFTGANTRVQSRIRLECVCVVLVDGWLLSVFVVTSCAAATAATTAHTPYRHHFDINLVLMCVWRSLPALHWSRMTGHMMPYYMNKLCVFNERWISWTWMEFIRYSVWRMHGPNNQKLKRIRWNMRKKKKMDGFLWTYDGRLKPMIRRNLVLLPEKRFVCCFLRNMQQYYVIANPLKRSPFGWWL